MRRSSGAPASSASELERELPFWPASTGYGLDLSTTGIGLVLLPTGVASYASLALAHDTAAALAIGSGAVGLAWGFILTGIASVVVRSAPPDSTRVAVAVNAVTRNTAVAIGAQVAFAIIAGAELAGDFPVDSAYTSVFAMGGVGAAVLLATSALMPGPGERRP